ncbi:MAG: hypothetical protein LC808_20255 [Actinobacteria bacterium]|nr:hypothetical protein [Actinomycetota bacterium]
MEARVLIAEAKDGELDNLASYWDHDRLQEIMEQAGNRGFLLLGDPDTNRVIGISLWDTKEEADATESTFLAHAAEFRTFMTHEPERETFDVDIAVLHEASIHSRVSGA